MRGLVAAVLLYMVIFGVIWGVLGLIQVDMGRVLVGLFWWALGVNLLRSLGRERY